MSGRLRLPGHPGPASRAAFANGPLRAAPALPSPGPARCGLRRSAQGRGGAGERGDSETEVNPDRKPGKVKSHSAFACPLPSVFLARNHQRLFLPGPDPAKPRGSANLTRFRFHVCFLCRLLFLGKSGRRRDRWAGACVSPAVCPPVEPGPPPGTRVRAARGPPGGRLPTRAGGAKESSRRLSAKAGAEHRRLPAARPWPAPSGGGTWSVPPQRRAGRSGHSPGTRSVMSARCPGPAAPDDGGTW